MNKKIRVIVLILIIFLLILILRTTYSKYTNKATANIMQPIGKWIIKINNTDITAIDSNKNPINKTFEINSFTWDTSTHVKDGKVAPGMKGKFEIIIDPTDTDTSFEYEIIIDKPIINLGEDVDVEVKPEDIVMKVTDITEVNLKTFLVTRNADGTISIKRRKKLDEIKSEIETVRLDTINVGIEWENNELNNEKDSLIGSVINNSISFPVSVRAIQYVGP